MLQVFSAVEILRNQKEKMPAEPMRIGPLLEKYPDMIDPLFLYYGSNKPRLFTAMPCEVTESHIITVF